MLVSIVENKEIKNKWESDQLKTMAMDMCLYTKNVMMDITKKPR